MKLTPESRLLLRIAARIVPPERREEWGREWEAELWYWLTSTPEGTLGARLQLARHCSGAVWDALYLRLDGEEAARIARHELGRPAVPVAAGLLCLLLIGVTSGWFAHARRAVQRPPFPHADRVAVLTQVGPFLGQRLGVPAAKVTVWDRDAKSLEGAAPYFWYHTVFGTPGEEVPAAKVGVSFFEILGVTPALGRLFRRSDDAECRDCAVLSYDFWTRRLDGDRSAIGRVLPIDGQPMRIIGVLPRDFWFLNARPDIWTPFFPGETWRVWDVPPAGGICRLRPGVSPATAQAELRATASRVMPRSSGAWVTVTPISTVILRSLPLFFPLFGLFLAAAGVASVVIGGVLRAAFGILTAGIFLAVVLMAAVEFINPSHPMAVWFFLVAVVTALYAWYQDQRVRCRVCLHRLTMPVRIGHAGQVLLDHAGTELACPNGHGMLYTPEMPMEAESWVRV